MKKTLAGVIAFLSSVPVSGEVCSTESFSFNEKASLGQLIERAKSLNLKKDEYETSVDFETRAAAAARDFPQNLSTFVIPQEFLTEYDADTQTMKLSAYSLPSGCSSFDSVNQKAAKSLRFGKSPDPSESLELGSTFCSEHVVSHVDGKPYAAKNGYGASVDVTPITEGIEGLYFGYGALGQTLIDGRKSYSDKPTFQFSASPEEAKSFKAHSAVAFLAKPAAPYLVEGTYYASATVAHPYEITRNATYLAVSAKCIAVVDQATGKVFNAQAMPTGK